MTKKKEVKNYEDRGVKPYDTKKKKCIVTDLDGTLALINGRSYFDPYKFDTDILNESVDRIISDIVYTYDNGEYYKTTDLIVITGRAGTPIGREKTEKWLNINNIHPNMVLMRKPGDYRNDYIVKSEIIQELQKEYNIIAAFDDRNSSCKAFRDNGVLCLQVWEDDSKKPCEKCKEWDVFFADKEVVHCPDCGFKLR